MTELVEETKIAASSSQTSEYVVYYIFGVLEILLAFRLVLKLAGASTTSGFVRFIYDISAIFVLPFQGIFRQAVTQGIETVSVLEPSTLVALIVYAIVAWGIVQLIHISSKEEQV